MFFVPAWHVTLDPYERSVSCRVNPSFYYSVTWREAAAIRRELDERYIPYSVRTLTDGRIAFVFPDLPPRLYVHARKIFGGNGIPVDNFVDWS